MYKIIGADGTIIGYTEAPTYIYKAKNGCYAPCKRETATGVAYGGTPYHLFGTEALDELADALVIEMDSGDTTASVNTLLGGAGGQAAEQLRRAIQMYAVTLTDEDAMQLAYIYPVWEAGVKRKKDELIVYGVNSLGDPQLYRVLKTHKAETTPDVDTTNYKAVGISSSEYPIWVQPLSNKDAYNKGDIVDRNGGLYVSNKNNNTDDPADNTGTWDIYEET